jgi:cytochrome c-type biogenesis protein
VLPLVPGYLSMVSGLSAAELTAARRTPAATLVTAGAVDELAHVGTIGAGGSVAVAVAPPPVAPAAPVATMRPMLRGIGLFIGGFTIVFVALGAVASGIGRVLISHKETLTHVSGGVVIALGVVLLLGTVPGRYWSRLGSGPLGVLTRLSGERRFHVQPSTLGTWAAPVMGMAFAFAWTPCIGPVLGVVLGLAEHNGTLAGGVVLLFAYSLGLGIPFVLTGLAFGRLTATFARARRGIGIVEVVAGVVLVAFGILLLTDNLTWVATGMQHVLNDIGLGRLSRS